MKRAHFWKHTHTNFSSQAGGYKEKVRRNGNERVVWEVENDGEKEKESEKDLNAANESEFRTRTESEMDNG